MEQTQQQQPPSRAPVATGEKKLTWSERQALAKKRAEEEEERSRSAAFSAPSAPVYNRSTAAAVPPPPAPAPGRWGNITAAVGGTAVGAAVASQILDDEPEEPEEEETAVRSLSSELWCADNIGF